MGSEKVKLILLSGLGAVAVFFKAYSTMITAVAVSVALDVLTGLIKAKVAGGVSSSVMSRGLLRKLGLFLALGLGIFLDWFVLVGLEPAGIAPPLKRPFALIICAYIVVNEAISVCENIYAIEPRAIPSFIVKWLGVARKTIDENKKENEEKKGDENAEGDA